ncbi:MAG: hypothetical protein RSE13_13340 [Planktothrix sp. GU0601_MAG3]|nr:MAG: hypothetical protein RSE13_13340 [Planktothrix sp. GU0601_MAG3]
MNIEILKHPEEDTGKGIDQFMNTLSQPVKILYQAYQLIIQK